MRKFLILIKKEVKELLTLQMVLPLVVTMVVFAFVGDIAGDQAKKSQENRSLTVVNYDQSPTAAAVIAALKSADFNVSESDHAKSIDEILRETKERQQSAVVIIPENFGQGVTSGQAQEIEAYTIMNNFSLSASQNSVILKSALEAINNYISDQLIRSRVSDLKPEEIKSPIKVRDIVVVGNARAAVSPEAVVGFISQQTTFIPIILFIVILFAAQMIATTIASEKENKTLETLLSAPVSRRAIVSSKMIGAGIVALLMALVYIFGFRYYMDGMTGGALGGVDGTNQAFSDLGLVFSVSDYLILGASLFCGILAALAIALIIGSFAEDSKNVQGLITPLMVLIIIPYFFVMFLDINTLTPALKYLIYAIPFSHPFLAAPNIFLGNFNQVIFGIIYQIIVFIVFVLIAGKIFSSDLILTLKLNLNRKKR